MVQASIGQDMQRASDALLSSCWDFARRYARSPEHELELCDWTDQVFGARTTNVLQRGTVYLGSLFFVLSLVLAVLIGQKNKTVSTVTAADTAAKVEEAKPVKAPETVVPKSLQEELPPAVPTPAESPAPAEVPADAPKEITVAPEATPAAPAETTPTETAPPAEPATPAPADAPAAPETDKKPADN